MSRQHHALERRHIWTRCVSSVNRMPTDSTDSRTPHPVAVDTPFEDGTFKLMLTFDESYPNKPPTVKFLSRMFHPNVYANGELCLDILQNRWSPTYDVAAILTSIQSLLHDPNPNSPANAEAAQLYRENMKEYVRRVRATVEDSWLDPEEQAAMEQHPSGQA